MLSDQEKRVFYAAELDAEQSAQEIARVSGVKCATVQRVLANLIGKNVIVGRTAVVDLARLGYSEFGIRLQIEFKNRQARIQFENLASKLVQIGWLAAVGGSYSYSINVVARNAHEALKIFHTLCDSNAGQIIRQDLCIRTERYRFWAKLQSGGARPRLKYHLGAVPEHLRLSSTEEHILKALNQPGITSMRDVARTTGIPLSTLLRNVQQLKAKNILLGFAYRLDRKKIGISQYRVYLRTRLRGDQMTKQILKVLHGMTSSRLFTICFGAWDYELAFDLSADESIRDCVEALREALPDDLREIEVAPVYQQIKLISFPIATSQPTTR